MSIHQNCYYRLIIKAKAMFSIILYMSCHFKTCINYCIFFLFHQIIFKTMIAYGVLKTSKVDFSALSFESKVKYTQIMSYGLVHIAIFFFYF